MGAAGVFDLSEIGLISWGSISWLISWGSHLLEHGYPHGWSSIGKHWKEAKVKFIAWIWVQKIKPNQKILYTYIKILSRWAVFFIVFSMTAKSKWIAQLLIGMIIECEPMTCSLGIEFHIATFWVNYTAITTNIYK